MFTVNGSLLFSILHFVVSSSEKQSGGRKPLPKRRIFEMYAKKFLIVVNVVRRRRTCNNKIVLNYPCFCPVELYLQSMCAKVCPYFYKSNLLL